MLRICMRTERKLRLWCICSQQYTCGGGSKGAQASTGDTLQLPAEMRCQASSVQQRVFAHACCVQAEVVVYLQPTEVELLRWQQLGACVSWCISKQQADHCWWDAAGCGAR